MDNTGQPVLSATLKCQEYFKADESAFKRHYGSSRIVSWFELFRDFLNNMYIKSYVLLLDTYQIYSKKTLCVKSYQLWIKNFLKSLK